MGGGFDDGSAEVDKVGSTDSLMDGWGVGSRLS